MLTHNSHTLREFDTALNNLHQSLMTIAYKAQSALDLAINGCLKNDENAINQVIADDEDLDELEKVIDEKSLHILAFFSPVATDLKLVLTSIRLSGMYERIGDECVGIAKRSKKLRNYPPLREILAIEPIYRDLATLFRQINKGVSYWDVKSLEILLPKLQELSHKSQFLTRHLAELPEQHPDALLAISELIFIGRSLERITENLQRIVEEAMLVSIITES